MSTKERSYTFRAAPDLAMRTRDAFRAWSELLDADEPASSQALRDAMTSLCLAVGRQARTFEGGENQSELFRATFELFVEATEKAIEDRELVRVYEEWAQADEEGSEVRRAALAAAADRWRDE